MFKLGTLMRIQPSQDRALYRIEMPQEAEEPSRERLKYQISNMAATKMFIRTKVKIGRAKIKSRTEKRRGVQLTALQVSK